MNLVESVAKELNVPSHELMQKSLKTYLEQRLVLVESELFLIGKQFGVKDVFELDQKIQEGQFGENETYDDFFRFDHLQTEREKLQHLLHTVE